MRPLWVVLASVVVLSAGILTGRYGAFSGVRQTIARSTVAGYEVLWSAVSGSLGSIFFRLRLSIDESRPPEGIYS